MMKWVWLTGEKNGDDQMGLANRPSCSDVPNSRSTLRDRNRDQDRTGDQDRNGPLTANNCNRSFKITTKNKQDVHLSHSR
ncbi:hypothetical protein EYF80_058423 [Liparis tanakae]|uniref:Uncharacterized protein n=1 Tax=Liparis tanakae TaxID=230148 RepID=A0A4Z2ERG3_9TELE|nr:hypothetical protein EYF80_058423 [Liparis tanakae]